MFAAIMSNNCSLGSWLTNSNVLHAVADLPQGPYHYSDIALGPRDASYWDGKRLRWLSCSATTPHLLLSTGVTQHNPDIRRAPDGTWLLFYMGSTSNVSHQNCR